MSSSPLKKRLLPGVMTFGFLVLAVPVLCAIGVAVWLAVSATFENMKFARCTEQILTIISEAQDNATKDPNFGQFQGEDVLDELVRHNQMISQPHNAWGGDVRVIMEQPPFMRVDTEIPPFICRRLAIYFGKNAGDIKLQSMSAHDENSKWITFFNEESDQKLTSVHAVNDACGKTPRATLSLIIKLR